MGLVTEGDEMGTAFRGWTLGRVPLLVVQKSLSTRF